MNNKIFCHSCQIDFDVVDDVPVMYKSDKLNDQEKKQIKYFENHYQKHQKGEMSNWQKKYV
ncbi:hypothetical protein ACFL1Y_01345 [Patescibacteria group bacterium]